MAAIWRMQGMFGGVRAWAVRLWSGEEPLARAFWIWSIGLGAILNVLGTFLVYALLQLRVADYLVVLAYVAPIPYNLFMCVAVWRAAARYGGSQRLAELARAAIVAWTVGVCAL